MDHRTIISANRGDVCSFILALQSRRVRSRPVPAVWAAVAKVGYGSIAPPLMLLHQIPLMVCAALARRYATADDATRTREGGDGARGLTRPFTDRKSVV